MRRTAVVAVALAAVTMVAVIGLDRQKLRYPDTRRVDQVDTYFGMAVEDPYRWLEDENSPETAKWVADQNEVTFEYLEAIPFRDKVEARLTELTDYPRYGQPIRRGEYFFYPKNDGLQNQSVYYVQEGLDGPPELLIDPNTFSADGTSQLAQFVLSRDGRYLAYGISEGGSDWLELHVMEVATRQVLPDTLLWAKVTGIAWQGDGFYYSRYDEPSAGKELTSSNDDHKIYFHHVGSDQSSDALVFQDTANPQRFHVARTTEDERFTVLDVSDRGKGLDGNTLYVLDAQTEEAGWTPLVPDITDATFRGVDNIGNRLLVQTNFKAPNWRVVLIDPEDPSEVNWVEVLPEKPEPLQSVSVAGGRIFATYMRDVATHAYVHDLTGKLENEVVLPGLGVARGFEGNWDDRFVFYTYVSFNYPPTIFRYDISTKESTVFRSSEVPGFSASDFESTQVFFNSKDGTRVPMYLVHKRGLQLDGKNPTLMYGYGGFNVAVAASFDPVRVVLLEQGMVYASVSLRGGSEYGETWHQAGMKLNKQNVFDDFIAAAEYLIANGYTSPARLGIQGASNGGLLVGAVANQRPDLFQVVLQHAGVMDMLRFQEFTIGWNWTADYGSSDNESEFQVLRAYSPIHNIREGVKYPATLTTTADHDDRVVPAHSFKYAAALQYAQDGDSPVLIRIDTNSGHGASNVTKRIEQTADIYAFLFQNLGVTPTY